MFTNKYAKKSDQRQKKIFYDLLKAESTNFLKLNKFKLFHEHKLGRIPTFPLTGLNLNIAPTYHAYQDDLIRAYATKHGVSMEYLERLFADPYQTVARVYGPIPGKVKAEGVTITVVEVEAETETEENIMNDNLDHLPNLHNDSDL